jgi:hypothetical protein
MFLPSGVFACLSGWPSFWYPVCTRLFNTSIISRKKPLAPLLSCSYRYRGAPGAPRGRLTSSLAVALRSGTCSAVYSLRRPCRATLYSSLSPVFESPTSAFTAPSDPCSPRPLPRASPPRCPRPESLTGATAAAAHARIASRRTRRPPLLRLQPRARIDSRAQRTGRGCSGDGRAQGPGAACTRACEGPGMRAPATDGAHH